MKRLVLTLTAFCVACSLSAQDVHFSQMRFSPFTVNPGLAGMDGKIQAIANYRSQWNSVAAPFTTLGASFDMKFEPFKRDGGFLAGGVNFFHDVAGDLKMTTSNVNLNLAYHLPINRESSIGLGMQLGYAQRGLGSSDGYWESQYDGSTFDQTISSGESFGNMSYGHLDAAAGVVYDYNTLSGSSFNSGGFRFTAGASVFHVNQPSYSFIAGGEDDLHMRYSGFVRGAFNLVDSKWQMLPGAYYQQQGGHREIYAGSYFQYTINGGSQRTGFKQNFSVAYGAYYRLGDAFVNKLLVNFAEYSIGMAYDLNVSSLTQASRGRGGIEFMLRYRLQEMQSSRARIN